jgi:glycosyltransferase involved in cell wall biosynthesis
LTVPLREESRPVREGTGRVVGVVTRLDRLKRVELFIEVLAELRLRDVDCVGLIVGDGRQRPVLEQHASALQVRDAIEFVGMQNDAAAYLDRFDVFLTTTSIESFGLAVLEAMARAVPVVAMPCPGGLPELVDRGGILLPNREVTTAAAVVEELLGSPDLREELGQRGRAVAATYSLDTALKSLDRLYEELIVTRTGHGRMTETPQ